MSDESSFGWLHLTDLHVGQPKEGGRLANIERTFLEDVARVVEHERLPIAAIFLSGDIAFRGTDAEYIRASAVLGRICDDIHRLNKRVDQNTPPPVLVPVPGNHDLMRPRPADADTIRAALANRKADSPPLWPAGQEAVRDLVDACFAGYRAWLRTHPLPFPPGAYPGLLPGDLRATVARSGISLGIVGLNSTCLHLGDVEPETLHLDLSQVMALLGPNPRGWLESHHFNVLMSHHPPSWLSPLARQTLDEEIKPDSLFDMHLYGHQHVGRFGVDPGTSGIRHIIEGRSLFGAEEDGTPRLHGYTVGRFVLSAPRTEVREKRIELWTRQGWRDGHRWRFGPSDERWGRWRLLIELGTTTLPNGTDTPAPALTPGLGRLDATQKATKPWTRFTDEAQFRAEIDADVDRKWIFLSASIPISASDADRREAERAYLESARPDAIRAFVIELARQVSKQDSGFGIIFGGHPSITQALGPVALSGLIDKPWLALVQDEYYWFNLVEEVGVVAYAKSVRPFLMTTGGTGADLEKLRKAMLSPTRLAAAVFVGGLQGIVDEFNLTGELRPDVPRFALGMGGGTAATLLLEQNTAKKAMGATPSHDEPRIAIMAKLWHTPKAAIDAILEAIRRGP